jgi:tetratricopeptide (TPR) repeat protein
MRKILIFLSFVFLSISNFAQNAKYNFSKAKDLIAKEDYNLALYYLDLAISEDTTYIDAFKERAHVYHLLKDYEKAIEGYNYVISKIPNCASCFFALGSLHHLWNNDQYQAISYFTKSIDISLGLKDNKQAGSGYFMRASMKKSLGDMNGYLADIELGASLGHDACIFILEYRKN